MRAWRPAVCLAAALTAASPGTGAAPAADTRRLEEVVDAAYASAIEITDGRNAQYIPALAAADTDRFAIVVVTATGEAVARGDADTPFAIMSAAKPFTLALLMEQRGPELVLDRIGVEPTGLPFNSILAMELHDKRTMNPMVNAGAIATVSWLDAESASRRGQLIMEFYGRLAGEPLAVLADVYASVSATNFRNRTIANLLRNDDQLGAGVDEALDVYNQQSSLGVTTAQLATMGATLANGGVNPLTGQRVMRAGYVDEVLAVMLTNGLYDESGWWAFRTGLPAKTGVGGGVVAIAPGKLAMAAFSPRLNASGNSVRGLRAIEEIARELGLSVFNEH